MRIEQGFAGHFIGADRCQYRRNTLVFTTKGKIIVSTVGAMVPYNKDSNKRWEDIGMGRKFETVVFNAKPCDCGCGEYVTKVEDGELDFAPASKPSEATENHDRICDEWEKK
jgi:hypothetical protein